MQKTAKNRFSAKLFNRSSRVKIKNTNKSAALPENKARKSVLRVLLVGTILITSLFFVLLLVSYFGGGNTYVKHRIFINLLALAYLGGAYILLRQKKYHTSSLLLVIFYIAFASLAAWQWGINLPFATLLMSITITLAGILLGARYSLYAASTLCAILIFLQFLTTTNIHMADLSWQTGAQSLPGEVLGYCLLFAILGLVSWIFGRQVERSLKAARAAKNDLQKEKRLLSVRLKERTEKLRTAQLKEMQQLYRFAELGQLSTALLHDLANHLTTLSLDIEDIESRRRSKAIKRAKESMNYLDELVAKVSQQIKDTAQSTRFNTLQCLEELAASLQTKFAENEIDFKISAKGRSENFEIDGDPTRFSQVMAILINNSIDAYYDKKRKTKPVQLQLNATAREISIKIKDWGKGVPPNEKIDYLSHFIQQKKRVWASGYLLQNK